MKQNQSNGQSLAEYGIILGLVAVVAIPSLTLLGDTLNKGMQSLIPKTGGTLTSNPAPSTPIIPSSPNGALPSPEAPTAQPPTAPPSPGQSNLLASYDPNTGKITYSLPDGSGGTHTGSIEDASSLLSNELTELAENWKNANGEPMEEDLKNYILDLANSGYAMADTQSLRTQGRGVGSMAEMGAISGFMANNPGVTMMLEGKANDFVAKYNALDSKLAGMAAQSPEYKQLKTVIDAYAGTISYVNYTNFMNGADTENAVIVGTRPVISVAVEDTAAVTTAASNGIRDTAH